MTEQLPSRYEIAQEFFGSNNISNEDLLHYGEQQFGIIKEGDCEYLLDKEGRKETLLSYTGTEERFIVPAGVKRIASNAFANNKYLKEIVFPNTLETIELNAFFNCTNLEEVSFPESLKYIGVDSFRGCSKIRYLTFPKKLERIMKSAFLDCQSLEKITVLNNNIYIDTDAFKNTKVWNINFKTSEKISTDTIEMLEEMYSPLAITIYDIPCSKIWEFAATEKDFIDRLHEGIVLQLENADANFLYNSIYPTIDFKAFVGTPLLNQYTAEEKEKLIIYCNRALRKVFMKTDKDKIISNIFVKMNYEKFVSNMKHAIDAGFNPEEIGDIIVNGNLNLLSTNIEDAFGNYQWLVAQKLLTTDVMKKFFFDDFEIHTVKDLKDYYDANHKLPDLFNSLLVAKSDEDGLQDLRDRLIYISTMKLLGKDNRKLEQAKRMMKHNLFSSIIKQDKINIIRVDQNYGDAWLAEFPSKYDKLEGIYYPLYSKMRGINTTWFDSFFDSIDTPEFKNFITSLATVKNWDTYSSEIERATDLKNEIVGRLLYADLLLKFGRESRRITNASKLVEAYKNGGKLANINIPFSDLLYVASKDKNELFNLTPEFLISLQRELQEKSTSTYIFAEEIMDYRNNQRKIIPSTRQSQMFSEAMLMIDPYSLVTLQDVPIKLGEKQDMEAIDFAHQYGYYIAGVPDNGLQCFIEYINNDIKIPMLPKEDKKEYLSALRESIHEYVSTQNADKLYDICNMFDFYLRASKEFEIEKLRGNNFSQEAKKLFDRTEESEEVFDNMSRVLYCMFNLNRLSKHDYDWRVEMCDETRLNKISETEEFFNKIAPLRKQVDLLQEYGLSLDSIHHLYMAYGDNAIFCADIKSRRNSEQVKTSMQYKMTGLDNLDLRDNEAVSKYINEITSDIENQSTKDSVQIYIQSEIDRLKSMTESEVIKEEKRKLKKEISILSNDNLSNLEIELKRHNCKSITPSIKEKVELISAFSNMFDFFKDYPNVYSILETAIYEEQVAYECKRTFANEAMERFGILTGDRLEEVAGLSPQEKKTKFNELGYAVEVQKDDRGDLVLACYCKGITDSFSIHLKSLPQKVEESLKSLCNPDEYLIATTKIPDRLRLSRIDISNCDKDASRVGFNPIDGLTEQEIQELRDNVAYKNATTFGVVDSIDKIKKDETKIEVAESVTQSLTESESIEGQQVIDDREVRFNFEGLETLETLPINEEQTTVTASSMVDMLEQSNQPAKSNDIKHSK